MERYDQLINTELFEMVVPEVYTKVIPKYFTRPNKSDLPRVNGMAVSWEEFEEGNREFVRDEEFTPDPIYNPCEMNHTTTMEPVAAIVDYLQNNSDLEIANPETAYPRIIEILKGYIDMSAQFTTLSPEVSRYLPKVRDTLSVVENCYEAFCRNLRRRKGEEMDVVSAFDKLTRLTV